MAKETRYKYSNIIQILTDNGPCWKLFMKQGIANAPAGSHLPVLKKNEEDQDSVSKMELNESIEKLNRTVSILCPDTSVTLLIQFAKNAKSPDWKGPFAFYNDEAGEEEEKPNQNQNNQSLNGFGGLGAMEYAQTLLGIQEKKNELELDKRDFKYYKERELEKIAEERKALKGLETEMKEALEKYNSQSGRVRHGLETYLEGIIEKFLPEGESKSLKGTTTETETEQPNDQERMIESIAMNINDHVDDINHIQNIGIVVQECIESPEACQKIAKQLLMKVA